MAEVGSAFVSILPSTRDFGRKMDSQIGPQIDSSGKKAGSRFGSALKVGALAVLGGAALVGKFLGDSLEEAREAQVVGARTENVIKKMGDASNISAKQVGELAGAISLKTGMDDEAIQSGQNLLLTFGNLRNEAGEGNDIFNQTSQLMVDMSAAMGTDAKGSAIQLGKALNDPVKGLTALSRVGVSFSEQQKEQIENFVEAGDTMKAQKVILGELERQFGGAAEAMATPADKVAVAWGNVKEQIGTALLPTVDRFLGFLSGKVFPALTQWWDNLAPARDAIGRLAGGIGEIVGLIQDRNWGAVWDTFRSAAKVAFDAVVAAARRFVTERLAPALMAGLRKLEGKWSGWWANFWNPPDRAYDKTEARTDTFMVRMSKKASVIGVSFVGNLMSGLSKMPGLASKVFARFMSALIQGLRGAPGVAAKTGVSIVGNLMDALSAAPEKARSAALFITGALRNGLGTAINAARDIGINIVSSLVAGIQSMAAQVAAAAANVVGNAIAAAKNKAGIKSPSKVFTEMGRYMTEGLAIGLSDTRKVDGAMDRLGSRLSIPRPSADLAFAGAGAGVGGGRQAVRLVVGGREFPAYMEQIADGRIAGQFDLADERRRAHR